MSSPSSSWHVPHGPGALPPVTIPHSHGQLAGGSAPSGDETGTAMQSERLREALQAWMQWNDRYENLSANMYRAGHDVSQMKSLAAEVDQLRQKAVGLTRDLIRGRT